MSVVLGLIVAGHLWVHSHYTPRADFEQHVMTQLCAKAMDNYFNVKALVAKHPQDSQLQIDLERALEMVNRVCPPVKGSAV